MPPKKRKNPYWNDVERNIEENMNSGVDSYVKVTKKKVEVAEKTSKKLSEVNKRIRNDQTAAAKESLKKISEYTDKEEKVLIAAQQNWLKRTSHNLNSAWQMSQNYYKKIVGLHQETEKKMPKNRGGGLPSMGFGGGLGGGGRAVAGELREIAGYLRGMVPAIAAIAGPSLFLIGVFERILKIQKESSEILRSSGAASINQFNSSLSTLSDQLRIDQDDLRKLSQEFLNAGVPVSELNGKMIEYLKASASGVRMFGLSNDVSAKYVRTLSMQGMAMNDIKSNWDSITGQMQSFNGTIQDANISITEGITAWEQYGAVLGSNIDSFQKGINETRGLFKSLNMDARTATSTLGSMFTDMWKRRRHAAYISNMSGMGSAATFNLMSDPSRAKEATALRMTSGIKFMQKMMGGDAQYLQQDIGGISDQEKQAQVRMKLGMARDRATSLGFDAQMMDGVMEQFRNYKGGADTFLPDMAKLQGSGKKRTTEEMLGELNATMPEAIGKLQRALENMLSKVADELIPRLPKIIEGIDMVVDQLVLLTPVIAQIAGLAMDMLTFWGGKAKTPVGKGIAYMSKGHVDLTHKPKNLAEIFLPGIKNLGMWGGDAAKATMDHNAAGIHKAMFGTSKATASHGGGDQGWLSSKFEGSVGSVAPAYRVNKKRKVYVLPGQAAYGAWQMDTGMNVPQQFMNYLKKTGSAYYDALAPVADTMGDNTGAFAKTWKSLSKSDPKGFLAAQKGFIQPKYLNPMLSKFPSLANSKTLQEVAFSSSVQHGPGGAESLFKKAGYGSVDSAQFIKNLYKERSKIMSGGRYESEKNLALEALMKEQNKLLTEMNGHLKNQTQIAMGSADTARLGVKGNVLSNQLSSAAARSQI